MNRDEYNKRKMDLLEKKVPIMDLVQPYTKIPDMFREEISEYHIDKDSVWKDKSGNSVEFGEGKSRASIFTPQFIQLVATGAGVTASGIPEIEKKYAFFDIVTRGGAIIKARYVSRVVGRISFKRLTTSGSTETKVYTTERDVDMLFGAAIVKDLGYDHPSLSTGNATVDSIAQYTKLNELGKHAYQIVDTKLSSHGREKFIGLSSATKDMIGGSIFVQRISYDPDHPEIKKYLAAGAVAEIVGSKMPQMIESMIPKTESVATEETLTDVTEDELPPEDGEDSGFVTETVAADATARVAGKPTSRATAKEMELFEWMESGAVKNPVTTDYIIAILDSRQSDELVSQAIEGVKELSKQNTESGNKFILASVKLLPQFSASQKAVEYVDSCIVDYTDVKFVGVMNEAIKRIKA